MVDMKWGVLSGETTVTPGTVLDSKADKSTSFLFDIDNSANRNLNLKIIALFGTITLGAGASGRFIARCKDGSNYCDNASESVSVDFPAGTNITPRICALMRIPDGGVWGIYFVSNLGTNTAASGNSIRYRTYNEAAE